MRGAQNSISKKFRTAEIAISFCLFLESAATLWKSATGVSSQGRKRGRAKGLLKIKNLNRGQKLGVGKERIKFPGLTSHATNRTKEKPEIGQIDEQEHRY